MQRLELIVGDGRPRDGRDIRRRIAKPGDPLIESAAQLIARWRRHVPGLLHRATASADRDLTCPDAPAIPSSARRVSDQNLLQAFEDADGEWPVHDPREALLRSGDVVEDLSQLDRQPLAILGLGGSGRPRWARRCLPGRSCSALPVAAPVAGGATGRGADARPDPAGRGRPRPQPPGSRWPTRGRSSAAGGPGGRPRARAGDPSDRRCRRSGRAARSLSCAWPQEPQRQQPLLFVVVYPADDKRRCRTQTSGNRDVPRVAVSPCGDRPLTRRHRLR